MKLIKFKQNNCTPCKMLDNYLEHDLGGVQVDQIANITDGTLTDVKTGEVQSDEAFVLAGQFEIMKSPTLVLLDKNGEVVDKFTGIGQTGVKAILAKRGLI